MKDSHKIIALVGQPNAGKSSLFNILSDIKTTTSNFSGTSVKVEESLINIYGEAYRIVDLPGAYSLNPTDGAEEVTVNYLMNNHIDLIINVMDASLITRSLELTIELMELGKPLLLAVNMQDEAERKGIVINHELLASELNVPVVPIIALFGRNINKLLDSIHSGANKKHEEYAAPVYTHHLEQRVRQLNNEISELNASINGSSRFYAIKSIENPLLTPYSILEKIKDKRDSIAEELFEMHKMDSFEAVSYERHHLAMKISEKVITHNKKKIGRLDRFDKALLHPIFGYAFLILFLAVFFGVVFIAGDLMTRVIDVPLKYGISLYQPLKIISPFLFATIDGAYQGIAGALGIILPYFLPLIFMTALFEETGYLARVAFLVDGIMHKIGLHGKSVAPFILGFGCSVPAIYATRIIENRRDRFLTAVLIPFIPCSARISVIFALTAAFAGPLWALLVFVYVLFIIGIVGKLISKFLKKPVGLIMEVPTLKKPSLKTSWSKTYYRIKEFMKDAVPYLIIGSVVLAWIELADVTKYLNSALAPFMEGLLNLPKELGSTLFFGFLRKELALIMASQAMGVSSIEAMPLSLNQVMTFIIFVTLYFPCLTTAIVMWKEFSWKTMAVSGVLSISAAIVSGMIFNLILAL